MKDNKKIMYMVIGIAILLISLVGVTYSFFNYTRTGSVNNIGTGRIYFNSTQNGVLNMTNIFPLTSTQASSAQLDTVTVGIEGDTTYADGEEFQVTLTDVTNTVNGKKIPINYIATYTANTGAVMGTSSSDYWNARNNKDANIYTLESTGSVEEGKQVLVGYIDNGETGINGTLTIKAYIDAERIAITDTYPRGNVVEINTNMSITQVNDCVSYLSEFGIPATEQFCNGTGTIEGPSGSQISFQNALNQGLFDSEMVAYFVNHNIVNDLGENDTTTEWVNGRTVLTTEEWNSFQTSSTPISFKIRAESNEGIWVQKPIESCPGCKFMYTTSDNWTTWNNLLSQTPTQITSGLYENYQELIATTGKNYFLGVKLNSNNEVTNAYACGVKEGTPFCIEGYSDNSKYSANQTLLQGANLYNNTCTVQVEEEGTANEYEYTECGPWDNSGSLSAGAGSYGGVRAGVGNVDDCIVGSAGNFRCRDAASAEPFPGVIDGTY